MTPFTVAVDTGSSNTAIGARRGNVMLNAGVFRPRINGLRYGDDIPDDPTRELWKPSGSPYQIKNAAQTDIVRSVVLRVRVAHDWLVDTYAHPGETVHVVVESPSGVPHGKYALHMSVAQRLADAIAVDLDCEVLQTEATLHIGDRHRKGRPGAARPIQECYPDNCHDVWPEWAYPDVNGRRVRQLPNEDVGKRRTQTRVPRRSMRDVRAVYDIAAVADMDKHEREALKRGRDLSAVAA